MSSVDATALERAALTGVVHQDAAHRLGGGAVEMPPVLDAHVPQSAENLKYSSWTSAVGCSVWSSRSWRKARSAIWRSSA